MKKLNLTLFTLFFVANLSVSNTARSTSLEVSECFQNGVGGGEITIHNITPIEEGPINIGDGYTFTINMSYNVLIDSPVGIKLYVSILGTGTRRVISESDYVKINNSGVGTLTLSSETLFSEKDHQYHGTKFVEVGVYMNGGSWSCTLVRDVREFYIADSKHDQLFSWAENNYSDYFSPSGQQSFEMDRYLVRYYSKTKNYVGIKDDLVYVLGKDFNELQYVGTIDSFLTK